MCKKLICFVFVLGLILTSTANADDPNLVGWWTFDEGEGTVAADLSGNGYDGTVIGATWVDGLHGGALDMAGVGYVDIPVESWSTIEMQVTISFWAFGDPAGVPNNFIVGAFQDPAVNDSRVLTAHLPWGGTVYFDTGGTAPGSGYDRISKGAQSDEYLGDWRLWTFTKDADTGDQKIYLDGELWHSDIGMIRPMTGVTKFTLGVKPSLAEGWYRGMMDDVKLYDRALTDEEVKALFYRPGAYGPNPTDGATSIDTTSLEWTPGTTAVSHKVYLSTDETIDESDLAGETAIALIVPALEPGATYYWRVDEVDADGTVFEGDVWSFSMMPLEAHFPSPSDGQGNVMLDAQLSWTAGKDAIMHNVNFGTDAAALVPVSMMQMDATYDPGPLEKATTYYWRVDEFAGVTTNAGPVWSFTTIGDVPALIDDPNLEGYWTFDEGMYATALDVSGNNRHGALHGDPQWVAGYDGSALEFDGIDDYVNIDGYKGINAIDGVQQPFSVANWFRITATSGNHEMVTWGTSAGRQRLTWRVHEGRLRTEHASGNLRGNTYVNDGEWHHGALVVTEGANLRVPATLLYVDGVEDTTFSGSDNPYELTAGADVRIGMSGPQNGRYWPGSIDDVLIYSRALTVEDVRTLAGVAELPYSPDPADGEIDLPDRGVVLTWNPAIGAVEQDVYLGTDADAVAAAGRSDTTGIYRGRQAETTYAADLEWGATHYWRVDQISVDGVTTCTTTGPLWSFTVADYIVIETQETTLDYDNRVEPFVSEAAWDTPADLTVEGVSDLTLRFHGAPAPEDRGSVSIDEATGTYTITGAGADIWGTSDQFHYGYVQITGDATITARVVDNGTGSNTWAKGGVMIRQSLDAGSTHRYMPITGGGGNGASFQGRPVADAGSNNSDSGEVVAPPYWVKLERVGNDFTGSISPDGITWTQLGGVETVVMEDPVLIGLAVTSHQSGELRTFTFDNLDIVGNIISGIESRDIGIAGNSAEPIYVALEDSAGVVGVVTHPDPAATQIDEWSTWTIPLSDFSDAGVDITAAAKLYIGVGDGEPGGYGSIRIDDILIIKPVGVANIAWVSYHGADDAPHSDAAAVGFTEAPDIEYTNLLKAQGYNVTRVLTSGTPDVEFLNTMDLVIISRTASSGHYSNDGATMWNSITSPMINLNGYTLRSSRLGFTDGTDMPDTTGDITLTVTDPAHPIFAGIELVDGTMVNLFAEGAVPLPTDGVTLSRGISINNNNLDDEGTVLATIAEVSADTGPVGGIVIAELPAGATMENSSGSPTDVLGGPRLVFLTGSREPSGVTGGQAAALYDLYEDGTQMFLNAVEYMLP